MDEPHNLDEFFESQKRVYDHRAARGFPPGPGDAGRESDSARQRDGKSGDTNIAASLIIGLGFIMWKVAAILLPIGLSLLWEAAKLAGRVFVAVIGGRRSR